MAGREYVSPSVPAANTMLGMGSSRFNSNGFGLTNGADAIGSNPNFLSPSTFSNTTPTEFGLQPNKSIPYHYSCKSVDESRFSPGALMFAIRNPRKFQLSCPEGSRRVEDLIELNAWLARLESYKDLDTVETVLQTIKLIGVLKTKISESQRERQLGSFVLKKPWADGRAPSITLYWYG
jgi:hypothetical protein